MAFEAVAPSDYLAGRIRDHDLQSLRRGMDQDAFPGLIRVDPRAREGEACRAGTRKPEVPGFEPASHEQVVALFVPRRNDTRDDSRASLQEARRSRLRSV
jgi:hypothetical protein